MKQIFLFSIKILLFFLYFLPIFYCKTNVNNQYRIQLKQNNLFGVNLYSHDEYYILKSDDYDISISLSQGLELIHHITKSYIAETGEFVIEELYKIGYNEKGRQKIITELSPKGNNNFKKISYEIDLNVEIFY